MGGPQLRALVTSRDTGGSGTGPTRDASASSTGPADARTSVRRPARLVEATGIEPATPCLQSRSSTTELRPRDRQVARRVVGLCGLEPQTLRLSGVRSNHLSYRPAASSRPQCVASPGAWRPGSGRK